MEGFPRIRYSGKSWEEHKILKIPRPCIQNTIELIMNSSRALIIKLLVLALAIGASADGGAVGLDAVRFPPSRSLIKLDPTAMPVIEEVK